MDREDSFEEIALELAGAVIRIAGRTRRKAAPAATPDPARIAGMLRHLEARVADPQSLTVLYLLHGAGDTFATWSERTDVEAFSAQFPSSS